MKIWVLTGLFLAASLTVPAQGKVNLINDSASLVTMRNGIWDWIDPGDLHLLGQPVGNEAVLHGGTLVAGLYGGRNWNSMFLYSTFTMNATYAGSAGVIGPLHIILNANPVTGATAIPGIASGTPIGDSTPWFQVKIWDSRFASWEEAMNSYQSAPSYLGNGAPFQMIPGTGLTYINTSPNVNSTWSDGPIIIVGVPEPAVLTVVGLGAVLLMACRRGLTRPPEEVHPRPQTGVFAFLRLPNEWVWGCWLKQIVRSGTATCQRKTKGARGIRLLWRRVCSSAWRLCLHRQLVSPQQTATFPCRHDHHGRESTHEPCIRHAAADCLRLEGHRFGSATFSPSV